MEENENVELIKPEFSGEIVAHIKSVGEIESNMKEVKTYVENLNNYYKNVEFTEETMKEATDEKAKVNKFKEQVSKYRKNIISEYNKPIKNFENTAKETEQLLSETYNIINSQVSNYREKQKKEIEKEIREFFEEYKQSLKIDFVKYEDAKINITLNSSKTALQKQVKDFLDKINIDLATIALQKNKDEIIVEYKTNGYNLNEAIQKVIKRLQAIEEEKKKQEEEKTIHIEMNKNHEITKESYEQLENIFNKPLPTPEIEEKKEEILTLRFTVKGTRTKLKALKEFLISGGYEYE